jgi:hypothetical protein
MATSDFDAWIRSLQSLAALQPDLTLQWEGRACALLPPTPLDADLAQWCVSVGTLPVGLPASSLLAVLQWQVGQVGRLPVMPGVLPDSRELIITQGLPWVELPADEALGVLSLLTTLATRLQARLGSDASHAASPLAGAAQRLRALGRGVAT